MALRISAKPSARPSIGRTAVRPSVKRVPTMVVASIRREERNEPVQTDVSNKGAKDANATEIDQEQQFEVQQDRLEWRKKNQGENKKSLENSVQNWPKTNVANLGNQFKGDEKSGTPYPDDRNPLQKVADKLTGKE